MQLRIRNAVIPLLLGNIIFFILQQLITGFTGSLALVQGEIFARPWILVTHMFLHGGFAHLFFNMYALFLFGPLLEQKIGTKRFLMVYFVAGIIAAFFSSFIYQSAVGASAAIMGMLGALIIVRPNLRLLFFFAIPMKLWVAGIIWAALDIFGIFYPSGVANIAHLIGLGVGILFGYLWKTKSKQFQRKFSKKKHLEDDDIQQYLTSGRI